MKVAIVCFNDTFFDRVRLLKRYYQAKGHEVTVISSDFSHRKKQRISILDDADTLISTPPYYKNLSLRRLYSHHRFSRLAEAEMERLHPDIIHSMVPANSLCKAMARYKSRYPKTRLYFDINDPKLCQSGILNGFRFSLNGRNFGIGICRQPTWCLSSVNCFWKA